jgi:phage-related minor tail protein
MAILDELLVRLGVDMSDAESEIDRGSRGITGRLDGLAVAGGVAAAGLGAAFVTGLESAMDISSATTQLQNQLSLTDEEAARAGSIAGDVFSAGFGESVGEVTTALGGISSAIGDLGGFTEAELETMSKSALGLAKTFEVDVADATGAVGKLIKTGLVSDATEGFDLITTAMQKVPAELRDDLLPTIQEYSTQFRRVGLDGQTSMGLLQQAVEAGARDLDQVADALGQFGERALAGGKPVEDAFKSINLDAADMAKMIGKGGKSAEQALQMTMDALRGTGDEQVKLNAAAALFGDPANVMGEALFALDPATAAASTGMADAAGAAKALTDGMEGDPAQQWNSIMNTLSTTLGQMLLPALRFVSELFKEHPGLLQIAIPIVLALAAGLAIAAAAQWAMNAAFLANPMTWIIVGIVALIAVIVAIATKTTWFQDLWRTVWGGIRAAASAVSAWFTGTLLPGVTGVFSSIGRGAGDMWRTVKGWWNRLVGFVTGIPGRISSAVSGMWDGIPRAFKGAINGVIGAWNNLSFTIGGGSIMGVDIPSITLSTPNIPMLAKGGIATGATLAMVGEGREDEAILPLSRLEQMINTARAPSVNKVQPTTTRVVFDVTGADEDMKRLIARIIRLDGPEALGLPGGG